MAKKIIPVVLTFDEGYVIPAGVAMHSLLKKSNPKYIYEFIIIHNGLSVLSQKKLIKNLETFDNVKTNFIYCDYSFRDEFLNLNAQQHFAPEMFYKLMLPSLLPNYDKIVMSDVDVLFAGDISELYNNFKSDNYLAAIKHYSKDLKEHLNLVYDKFDKDYKQKVNNFGAGFLLYNLKKMREDNIESKLLSFLKTNIDKLIYPEQECLNYICSKKTEYIDLKYMAISAFLKKDLKNADMKAKYYAPYTKQQAIHAFNHPVQIHYAGKNKPWNSLDCDESNNWFKELCDTVFLQDHLKNISQQNITLVKDAFEYHKKKFKYYRYKFLSKITFGNTRKHYKQKRKNIKARLEAVKQLIK